MKILVYGAGVLGCNLARNLLRTGKDVTLFARGNWAAEIKQNGLRIKDKFSLRTSVSRIPVVTELAPAAIYDVVFVVLRYTQLDSALDTLRANRTKNIVFVGNNVQARALGEFAPKFAELNDNVLFGQVWNREDKLSLRDRSIVTVVALLAQGLIDSSFQYHLTTAKNNGVTKTEIAEILTHAAFYAGWPKAWAAFRMAKEVWAEDDAADAKAKHQNEMVFPIGV